MKGVVGRLRLVAAEAATAAEVMAERTEGIRLDDTPFAALPRFVRKLSKAVKRRRETTADIVLWTVTREEAQAGYSYLLLFSHEDAPTPGLNNAELDAIHNVALDLLSSLLARKGRESLDVDDIQSRIRAWQRPDATNDEPLDKRWITRLKRRDADRSAFFQQLLSERRAPIPDFARPLLLPRKTTGD